GGKLLLAPGGACCRPRQGQEDSWGVSDPTLGGVPLAPPPIRGVAHAPTAGPVCSAVSGPPPDRRKPKQEPVQLVAERAARWFHTADDVGGVRLGVGVAECAARSVSPVYNESIATMPRRFTT